MRFTKAYSAGSLPGPTFGSILTGKYPGKTGLTDDISTTRKSEKRLIEPKVQDLPFNEMHLSHYFKKANYSTSFWGKWPIPNPMNHSTDSVLSKSGFDEGYVTSGPKESAQTWQEEFEDTHLVDFVTEKALPQLSKDNFFMMVSLESVSEPLAEHEQVIAKYHENSLSQEDQNNPILAAMVERIDMAVGRLLSELERLNKLENTIILFSSTNGGDPNLAALPLKGGKGHLYQGGIQVPIIYSWPGTIKQGLVNNSQISTIDVYPTLAKLTGHKEEILTSDGIDLSQMLVQGKAISRNTLYWHFPHYSDKNGSIPGGAIISTNFKLIESFEGRYGISPNALELYDLNQDPDESFNLVKQNPTKAQELKEYLETWRKVMGAEMPAIR